MSEVEPLSMIDRAWLRMDRSTNLMMICGVMIFTERLGLAAVRETIRARLLCFHRFRQRVVVDGAGAHWETDPGFDLNWRVRRIALPGAGAGGSALALRIHHCYGDGFALAYVVACLTDDDPAAPALPAPALPAQDVGAGAPRRSAWTRLPGPLSETLGDAGRLAASIIDAGGDWIAHPARVAAREGGAGPGR